MNLWTDLISAAMLGSGRGTVAVALPGRLGELLGEGSAEQRLLHAAGILATVQLAAQTVVPSAEAVPDPALPETATPADQPHQEALLARILEKGHSPLLAEACNLLADTGHCLPPRLLPRALELGRQSVALRKPLRRALGYRGAWLAAQNPDWQFAVLAQVETADPRLWDEGDTHQRAAFLKHRRATDPAQARRLLEAAFPGDAARDRALLLPALGENLGPEDEPFLATILASDRSKEVRAIAASLLSCLPDSDFAQRMIARLDSCLRSGVVIEPPAAFAPDWKADTLEEAPPAHGKLGERAWWLLQLVSYTPLPWWETRLALSPEDILAKVAKSDWKMALLSGFRLALGHQGGPATWVRALLKKGGVAHQEAVRLALTLAPVDAERALQEVLARTEDRAIGAQIIENADFPWSLELWQAMKQKLPLWLAKSDWAFYSSLVRLAYRVPVAALNETRNWPDTDLSKTLITEFSAILRQRQALHRCFDPSTPDFVEPALT